MPRLTRPAAGGNGSEPFRAHHFAFASITGGSLGDSSKPNPTPKLTGGFQLPNWKLPQIPEALWVLLTPPVNPSRRRLVTVQDFFAYTEKEGRSPTTLPPWNAHQPNVYAEVSGHVASVAIGLEHERDHAGKMLFKELDRDGDGRLTVDDMKAAMRRRNLPEDYGKQFINEARQSRWWQNSIGCALAWAFQHMQQVVDADLHPPRWDEFQAMLDEREPKMLKAFTAVGMTNKGTLELNEIKGAISALMSGTA